MTEIWKDIQGYEGRYKVSNLGNVKSLNYAGRGYERNLTPKVNNSGRLWVELRRNGDKRQFLIHRLVGFAFVPNPMNYPQINHKDENPKNNRAENLEWCTQTYNIQYTLARHPERKRKVCHYSPKYRKMAERKVAQIDLNGATVKTWKDARTIFLETGMSQWSITQCCDGKRKKAYGFRWQYAI